jgi:hypothetical protein
MTFAYQTTIDVLGQPGTDSWGDPTLGAVLETIPASIVDTTETVTDPATGKVSVVQQWELYIRKGTQNITSATLLRGADGTMFDVTAARRSPLRRGDWLVMAKVRAG